MKPKPQEIVLQDGTKYKWKGNKKQRLAMELWVNPTSETFGNAYRSFLAAGFSPSYSKNVVGQAPKWISEYIDKLELSPEHIKQGISEIALNAPNSRSPDDTRLKAFEVLADIAGISGKSKGGAQVTIVQPILGGASMAPRPNIPSEVIEQDS